MPNTVDGIAFAALAVALVGGALGMLTTRNIMHAGFWLLEVSVAAAGVYALLDANYALHANAADMIALHAAWFGQAYTDALAAAQLGAVPEPASLGLLGLGAVALAPLY